MSGPLTLAVESSCDETSAALLRGEDDLVAHVVLSQDVHQTFGGVVPELASRAHLRTLDAVVAEALRQGGATLRDVDLFGVTAGPGLIGALLVGVAWTKGAAWATDRPIVGVHHMEAHLFAASLEEPDAHPPFVSLLVSGGHTLLLWVPAWGEYRLLGSTRDDAAGEAFDKAAKLLGLEYPGGPAIERAARQALGVPVRLPRPLLTGAARPGDRDYYDFSFSGLKTALRDRLREEGEPRPERVSALAAGFQSAVVDVLVAKTQRAVREFAAPRVVLGGGVANSRALREAMKEALGPGVPVHAPSARLAPDNAAMVARAAAFRFGRGEGAGLELNARPDLPFPGLTAS